MSAAEEFIKEVWGLQGAAYLVLGLRYYARIATQGWSGLAWDDFGMFLATLVYTAESVAAYFVVAYWQGYANNAMTDEQRAALDPASEEFTLRVNGSKTHVIGLLLYTTLLWILKGCWVFYYTRLTEGVQSRKRLIQISMVLMPATYVSCLLVAFFKCIPFDHQWQISPSPGNNCMPAVSTIQTIWVMIMNTLTDIYLMGIPLPMIWKAQLPWRKKLSIMFMFSGGFLEMAFGIMRCISILTVGDSDPAQSGYWSVRESFVSYVLTNLPIVYPLIRGFVEKSRVSLSKSTKSNGGAGTATGTLSTGYRLDSYPGARASSKRGPLATGSTPAPGSASEENIISPLGQMGSGGRKLALAAVQDFKPAGGAIPDFASDHSSSLLSQDSDAGGGGHVVYIQSSPTTPRSAGNQVTVLSGQGARLPPPTTTTTTQQQHRQQFDGRRESAGGSTGIVVTREYEFTVTSDGRRR